MIEITDQDFSIDEVVRNTVRPAMGGSVMFLGTVRDNSRGKRIEQLEFEADPELAVQELERIRQEAIQLFGVTDVSIVHRTGVLRPGENIVIIVVGAAHRDEAFKGCRYAIDELKKRAQIWKKEFAEDGSYWVGEEDDRE
ncbi:MAG: molybdenum cofactor biosynthesis protein MoaE [Candidatus Thorarchaeota archaeon]